MKTKLLALTFTLLALLAGAPRADAQGNAFRYQGRLTSGGGNATGSYDFKFRLYNAASGPSQIGAEIPANAVSVQNGLFEVVLNFGVNSFEGSARWLEMEVRQGAAAFTLLTPRQRILPTPYAIYAGNAAAAATAATATTANGVAAGAVNGPAIQAGAINAGKIASGQVVKTLNGLTDAVTLSAGPNVTLTPSGNNLQIAASAPGGGGLTWQVVSGTAQQAQPNTGYLLANAAQTTLTLPATPNVGDVVRVSSAGAGGWKMALNPGQSVVTRNLPIGVGGSFEYPIFLPIWTGSHPRYWSAIASSADGSKLVALTYFDYFRANQAGQICTSTDSGMTWTTHESRGFWSSVASSSDGTKLVAVGNNQIYTSTDSGVTWTPRESNRSWQSVASSTDGVKLVAVVSSGQIYTSTDSGVIWTPRESSRVWVSVASSADGVKLVALDVGANSTGGQIYTSTDSGVNWTPRESSRVWGSVASSTDGTKLVAGVYNGKIFTSIDSGVNWTPRESSRYWVSVASSADGVKLVAAVGDGQIYTSIDSGVNWTPREGSRPWLSVASSADGTKLAAVVNNGHLYTSADSGVTWNQTSPSSDFTGIQYSAIELQYIGGGQFMPVSLIAPIVAPGNPGIFSLE